MTKRFTIAMVALALFVLMAIAPVSAAANGTSIDAGATVFIGEEGLNLTHAMSQAYQPGGYQDAQTANTSIGWWASAAVIKTTAPTKVINLAGRLTNFQVAPADFVGYTGNWYALDATGSSVFAKADGTPSLVITVADPTLDIKIWDVDQITDISGKSVPQGTKVRFRIDTNMYPATYNNRNNSILQSKYVTAWSTTDGNGVGNFTIDASTGTLSTSHTPYNAYGWWTNTTTPTNVAGAAGSVNQFCNFTAVNLTTTGLAMGQYMCMYWNESAPSTSVSAAGTSEYGGRNWSINTTGLRGSGASPYSGAMWSWGTDGITNSIVGDNFNAALLIPNRSVDGFIDLKVKDESGTTFVALYNNVYNTTPITKNFVNVQPFYWGSTIAPAYGEVYWMTDALESNASTQYAYPPGTYTISAESKLNKMKDNYKNAGADYTGKTVSQSYTLTLVSDTVKIEANKDSVVRSKPFSVTVTGKPSTLYYVWVKGTSSMDGGYDNQPPMIALNQEKVYNDTRYLTGTSPYVVRPIGIYQYENGAGLTIKDDVGTDGAAGAPAYNGTRYYCAIITSTSGTRTVEFVTSNWTKAQTYTIRVENRTGAAVNAYTYKTDEVDVKVEKGAVTIVAAGDQSYYLGEEIKFSGTNTETYKTYLFLIGPNLHTLGSDIKSLDPRKTTLAAKVINNDASTFKVVDVNGDNTWSWKWGTSNIALDAGTYTIYAVSQPYDKDNLANAAYGTVSIIIKKPFVSATASQSTVAKGDRIYITGTAEGDPNSVQIWILGKNYAIRKTEAVNSDASFKYEVRQEDTKTLYAGQYFVVVQHPMQNNKFDIDQCTAATTTLSTPSNYVCNLQQAGVQQKNIFTLLGAGSLQGSDAAEALVEGINSANVDDTYTKLQFLIEEPVIRIDAIGDKRVGDKFTITAQTNLAVDDEILVQVYSSSFKPTQKSQSGEFSGATGTVKVTKGDSGMNKISFDVDSSTFKPDEYIVTESAVIQEITGTALFNVLEGSAPTAAPTAVVTAAQTAAPTAAPTQAPTAAPTPVPTTKSPGYGALIALIGLGAVAFIVVRRH